MKRLLLMVIAMLALGCSTPPRPAKEAFAKLELGMTQAQVEQTVGKPASTFTLPDDKALVSWSYSEKDWVNFNDGKVFAVVYDEKDLLGSVPLGKEAGYSQAPLANPVGSETPVAPTSAKTPTSP